MEPEHAGYGNPIMSTDTTGSTRRATRRPGVPDKPALEGLEALWSARWEADGTYRFDRSAQRSKVFSIDTPPPTVSGSLHIGHVFSFTHTDTVARFQRMRGRVVFYPMGWDDNGLATERRVQNYFGVRCEPSLPFDPGFVPPERPGKEQVAISRPNFVTLCHQLTAEDEQVFEHLWRMLGLSVDWSLAYTTVSERARRVSQRGFVRLAARRQVVQRTAPTLWDVDFRTAVSQAELEDRERPGAYHRLVFPRVGAEGGIEIETTRPELLPACVALVAHPDDDRYRPLFGTEARTPLFGVRVPVVAHTLADPDKGSGIAMVCTFGDTTDVVWWRELSLPTRAIVGRDGRLVPVAWGAPGWESDAPGEAAAHYGELAGLTTKAAQARIVEALARTGALVGDPRPITHPVRFYERGERPLEIVTSRQWFVETLPLRDRLIARGEELRWHPPYMAHRYRAWVEGLNTDWNISRQRFFGVPFPVWYPVDPAGETDFDSPIFAAEEDLPVDPSTDVPPGYTEEQRGRPGGFVGDPDVMDTWATSSLTPQIAGGWHDDPELFSSVFPMDLRPQGHEIIRTWLFSTDRPVRARARRPALVGRRHIGLGARPRPQEDVEVEGQRDHAAPADRAARRRRRPVLGRLRPAGDRHRGGRGTDESRPAARHQDPQRLAVHPRPPRRSGAGRSAVPPGPDRGGDRPARPGHAGPAGGGGRGRHRGVRGLRLHPGPRAHRELLLVVLRRLPRAGQGPGLRRTQRARTGVGPGRPGRGALGRAPAVRPRAPLRHRGGVVVVASRVGAHRHLAGRR